MLSSLVVPLAFVTELVLGGPAAGVPAANVIAAQSAPANLTAQSDQAQRDVRAARDKVRGMTAAMRELDATYKTQLADLEKLSRQRASWNRDRKIAGQKAASQVTARRLSAAARQLRLARVQLQSARRRLLAALERELDGASVQPGHVEEGAPPPNIGSGARARRLARLRDRLRRELRPKPKKIVVPDIDIDPSDDPDDLAEKAQILARVETQLRREARQLDQRYAYYSKQERLRLQRDRANEIDSTENTTVRRNPTGVASTSDVGANEADPGTDGLGDSDGGSPPPDAAGRDSALEASSVTLADVVDDVTADGLRRASRSTDPATRARATRRARDQVAARLERLRKTRLEIERRARSLRK